MESMLQWFLSKLCFLSISEIVERRTELFRLIDGDVFFFFSVERVADVVQKELLGQADQRLWQL